MPTNSSRQRSQICRWEKKLQQLFELTGLHRQHSFGTFTARLRHLALAPILLWQNSVTWLSAGPFYDCGTKQKLGGIGDGGKWICEVQGALQRRNCVVYSLGSNMDTSFEEGIIKHTVCDIHTFDHSLLPEQRAAIHQISSRLSFYPVKIGLGRSRNSTEQEKSIQTIMSELSHSWIDVLKMDIEGGEWDVLEALIDSNNLHFTQLLVEFHTQFHYPVTLGKILKVLSSLTDAGYRVFSVEPNLYCSGCSGHLVEFSFIKVDNKSGRLIQSREQLLS